MLVDVTLTERDNGTGTITFGPTMPWYMGNIGGGWPGMGMSTPPAFESIPAAREVYDLIHDGAAGIEVEVVALRCAGNRTM